jgi:hypothetical protein
MGQNYEFLAKVLFLQKWIFIVVFGTISLVFNVFVGILVKNRDKNRFLKKNLGQKFILVAHSLVAISIDTKQLADLLSVTLGQEKV